jgi:hypothetical protein
MTVKYLPLLVLALPLYAEESPQCYFGFKRELSPDRPDTTESPYTVEPGKFQLESSLWAFSKDKSDGIKTETWAPGEVNLKAGLTPATDLQLVLRPWIHEQSSNGVSAEGFGDIEMRLKWNLWGNDSGKSAGAVMPYVSIPTQTAVSTGEWEGGVILPVAMELSETLGLGFQVETARAWDDERHEYDWDFLHSIVLGISITDKLGAFVEYVGTTGDGPYEATANTGLTWASSENLQWDVAVGVGLNDAAEDFTIAQGVSFRF